MEGSSNTTRKYAMKQCHRWDDDGTEYQITFEDIKEQPFRLVQRVTISQEDTIIFKRIPARIAHILPLATNWLEIWEHTHSQK